MMTEKHSKALCYALILLLTNTAEALSIAFGLRGQPHPAASSRFTPRDYPIATGGRMIRPRCFSTSPTRRHASSLDKTRLFAHPNSSNSTLMMASFFENLQQQQDRLEQEIATSKQNDSHSTTSASSSSSLEESFPSSSSSSTEATSWRNNGGLPSFLFLSELWKARLLLLAAACLYGTNFSVVKILDDTLPVGTAATLRFGLATLCTLPWLLAKPKRNNNNSSSDSRDCAVVQDDTTTTTTTSILPLFHLMDATTRGAIVAGFEVGLWNSIAYIAQAVGLQTTDASKSAFICSLAVVVVPLLEWASGKKLLPRQLTGAAMAVVGVGLLEFGGGGGSGANLATTSMTAGDAASLLQPLAFGMAFWRMEEAMRRYPNEANRSTAAQLLAVLVVSTIYCWTMEGGLDWQQVQTWLTDPQILAALFWTGTVTTALTVYMEALALKTLTAAETTILLSAEPLFGALFAALLIGEQFGTDAILGAVLILAGCLFSNLGLEGLASLFHTKAGGRRSRGVGVGDEVENVYLMQNGKPEEDNDNKWSLPITKEQAALLAKSGLASSAAAGLVAVSAATASEELELVEEVVREVSELL